MGNSDTSGQHINYIPPFARCFMSDAEPLVRHQPTTLQAVPVGCQA